MEVEKALEEVGGWRRWHTSMFVVLGIAVFVPLSWQGLVIIFIGWEPPHTCILPFTNSSNKSDHLVPGRCQIQNNVTNEIQQCSDGWKYDNLGYFTIVEKWDLVCADNYKAELTQLAYQLGGLASLVVFSPLSDRLGRKKVHIATHLLLAALGVSAAFTFAYYQYLVVRVVLGMLTAVNNSSGVTALLELFDSKNRPIIAIASQLFFMAANLLLCVMGYFIKEWALLQIIISASSLLWIILICILPESPLWLVSIHKKEEAEKILHKIARWNGVPISKDRRFICADKKGQLIPNKKDETAFLNPQILNSDFQKISDDLEEEQKPETFFAILKDCLIIKYLLIGSLLWFSNSMVYYGLYLSTPNMGGNRFISFSVICSIEIPALFIAIFCTRRFGRRYTLCITQLLAGVLLAILPAIPSSTRNTTNLWYLVISLLVIAKMTISASFSIVVFYTKELFPTNFRATGGGVTQAFGFLGSAIAPMASYMTKSQLYWLPNVLFGVLSISIGLLTLALPETGGKNMPQSVLEVRIIANNVNRYKVKRQNNS